MFNMLVVMQAVLTYSTCSTLYAIPCLYNSRKWPISLSAHAITPPHTVLAPYYAYEYAKFAYYAYLYSRSKPKNIKLYLQK